MIKVVLSAITRMDFTNIDYTKYVLKDFQFCAATDFQAKNCVKVHRDRHVMLQFYILVYLKKMLSAFVLHLDFT